MGKSHHRSLESLARGIVRCRKCPLWETRTRAVPGEGDPASKVMLVGEAPGEVEDRVGKPFVGRTGRFFTEFLEELDLSRDAMFITSSVKCRPPKNRNPRDQELRTCYTSWLEPQLEFLEPEVVVLMGKIVQRQVLGLDGPLKEIHGRVHEQDGRRYLLTYHPTAAMRFPDARKRMRGDFEKVKVLAGE